MKKMKEKDTRNNSDNALVEISEIEGWKPGMVLVVNSDGTIIIKMDDKDVIRREK
jgi:hypothetical protein